jgi:hypothetical protein
MDLVAALAVSSKEARHTRKKKSMCPRRRMQFIRFAFNGLLGIAQDIHETIANCSRGIKAFFRDPILPVIIIWDPRQLTRESHYWHLLRTYKSGKTKAQMRHQSNFPPFPPSSEVGVTNTGGIKLALAALCCCSYVLRQNQIQPPVEWPPPACDPRPG